MSTIETKRTRDQAGRNETKDIEDIVYAIHNRTDNGLQLIKTFKDVFGEDILDAKQRAGNRGVHYDFEILIGTSWKKVEHKGSQHAVPIPADQKPWTAGVQFHNGGCEKYSVAKKYAKLWYDYYIQSGLLKDEWKMTSTVPTFEEWFQKDVKCQGDPKTPFGKELKETVRKARGPKSSLLEKRAAITERFDLSDEELDIFKKEILQVVNEALESKEYWLTIHGDPTSTMYCKWYPKFTIQDIECMIIRKELDIWIDCICAGISFSAIIRWGKGAGFSNLRVDLR